jgi:hypothetical protein
MCPLLDLGNTMSCGAEHRLRPMDLIPTPRRRSTVEELQRENGTAPRLTKFARALLVCR